MSSRALVLTAGVGLAASGCAWDAGEPFAVLSPRLEARVDIPADRDAGMGWQTLASSYAIRFDRLDITAGAITLVDASETVGFDPANPPPGYSLCHNGHCHTTDGRLVAYEQIAAELGQGGTARPVVELPVGALDLVAGEARALACLPSCDLPLAMITRVDMDITRLSAAGMVRDLRQPPRIAGEVPWSLELDGADAPLDLSASVSLPADRAHAPDVSLTVSLLVSGRVLDHVAWSTLEPLPAQPGDQPAYHLSQDPVARHLVITGLSELSLEVVPER